MTKAVMYNYRGERVTLNEFCSICDNYHNCSVDMRERKNNMQRDWCAWASVGGTRVAISKYSVSDFVGPGGKNKKYPREDKTRLIRLLKAASTAEATAGGGG